MEGIYNATKNWDNVPDMDLSETKAYSDEGVYGYGKIETTSSGIKITKNGGTTELTRSSNLTPVIPYEEGKPLKARLPKIEEVYNRGTDANHCHDSYGSCPAWLTNGLQSYSPYYPDNDHILGINEYWTLSSYFGNSTNARNVNYNGNVNNNNTTNDSYGARPVITVSTSDLSN